MKPVNKRDYDTTFSLSNRDIKCYSKKKLSALYPTGSFILLGETFSGNKKPEIDRLKLAGSELIISECGANSRFRYARKHFLAVGKNKYVCLLKDRLFPLLLLLFLLGTLLGLIFALLTFFNTPVLAPDYPLPAVDTHTTPIENDNSVSSTSEAGGGSVRVRFSNTVKVNLATNTVSILYQNPNQSNQDSVLTLVLEKDGKEYILARSGLVKTGSQLTHLSLNTSEIRLTSGIYRGKFLLDHYHPATGEKALTSSSFDDVEIQVYE